MNNYRTLAVVVGALLVVGTTVGTGGFSAMNADRGVDITVVDDDRAYLGVDRSPSGTANGTTNLTVTITNRLGSGTTLESVTLTATLDDASKRLDSIQTGELKEATLRGVSCDGYIEIRATGESVEVSLSRAVIC
jgi:hypothetical protein